MAENTDVVHDGFILPDAGARRYSAAMKPIRTVAAAFATLVLVMPSSAQEGPASVQDERAEERAPFDLEAIQGLVDRDRIRSGARVATLEERAQYLVREHMRACWQAPDDLRHARFMIVTVEFNLNADGTLQSDPLVVAPVNYRRNRHTRAAAERAIASIRACAPFPLAADAQLAQHPEVWRTMQLTFRADQPPSRAPR